MAQFTTANAIGEREDLSDVITRIDPDETPIFSALKKETGNGVFVEWQVQELAAAVANNHQNEGADATYATPTATTRLGNYMQISQKDAQVSGTLDAVDKAGRDKEVAYQKVLKGLELRRDIEKYLHSDTPRSGSDPRKAGTLSSWITNVSPAKKAAFSDLNSGSVATNQINYTAPREAAIVGSVSLYLSDFGQLDVVIDRFAEDDRVYLLDSDYASICTLPNRNFTVQEMAKTGDSEKFQIITEFTLKVSAPKAHAAVYDLN